MIKWEKTDEGQIGIARKGQYEIKQWGNLGWGVAWTVGRRSRMFMRVDDMEFCKAVAEFHANYVNVQERCHPEPGCTPEDRPASAPKGRRAKPN